MPYFLENHKAGEILSQEGAIGINNLPFPKHIDQGKSQVILNHPLKKDWQSFGAVAFIYFQLFVGCGHDHLLIAKCLDFIDTESQINTT